MSSAILLAALAVACTSPTQQETAIEPAPRGPAELTLSGQPGRGTAAEVQDMIRGFISGELVGTAVEIGRVVTPTGTVSLVRWSATLDGNLTECYGWIRGEEGTEVCGLPSAVDRGQQGPIAESSADDIPIELRPHVVFLNVPADVNMIVVTTTDGTTIRSPAIGGLAYAEWQGHGRPSCITGLQDDGTEVELQGDC